MNREFEYQEDGRGRSSCLIISILFHPGALTPSQNDTILIFAILLMSIVILLYCQLTKDDSDKREGDSDICCGWQVDFIVIKYCTQRPRDINWNTHFMSGPGLPSHHSMLRCILLCCEEAPGLVGSRDLDCRSNKEHFADCVVSSNNKLNSDQSILILMSDSPRKMLKILLIKVLSYTENLEYAQWVRKKSAAVILCCFVSENSACDKNLTNYEIWISIISLVKQTICYCWLILISRGKMLPGSL